MPIDAIAEHKSAHRLAFDHYLRTGRRLTTAQWLQHVERKFNPYHDEIGRFTSAPGVTVSWGAQERQRHSEPSAGARAQSRFPNARTEPRGAGLRQASEATPKPPGPGPDSGMRSELIREQVVQGGYADTYFELNKRQAQLNALRAYVLARSEETARTDPKEAQARLVDLADAQARQDANRVLLDQRSKVADKEIVKAFRKVNPVVDVGAATINVIQGDADLDDAAAIVTNVPILKAGKLIGGAVVAGMARTARLAKPFATSRVTKDTVLKVVNGTIQRGGAHKYVRGIKGNNSHHIPQDAASPIAKKDGPAITMTAEDHGQLISSRSGARGKEFLRRQKEFIGKGDYRSAMNMEINNVRELFGDKYDDGIEQMLSYSRSIGIIK